MFRDVLKEKEGLIRCNYERKGKGKITESCISINGCGGLHSVETWEDFWFGLPHAE